VEEKPGLECSDSRSLIYCLGGIHSREAVTRPTRLFGRFSAYIPLHAVSNKRSPFLCRLWQVLKNEAINIVDFAILEELTGNGISKLRGKAFMRPRRLAYMALWGVSLVQLYRNCLSEYVGHFKTSPDFVIHEAMTLLDMDLGSKAKALQN